MMRVIVAFLTGEPTDEAALATAVEIAKRNCAHVDAIFVRADSREIVYAEDLYASVAERERSVAVLQSKAKAAFATALAQAGVGITAEVQTGRHGATGSFTVKTGHLADIAVREAEFADLLVFPFLEPSGAGPLRDAVMRTLLDGRCSVLIAPPEPIASVADRVVAGWDDSLPAARALSAALPLMHGAIRLVSLGKSLGTDFDSADAMQYLKLHGFDPAISMLPSQAPSGKNLLDVASGFGCDLLVVGAYGHNRTLEALFGGTTEHVLSHARVPILLAH